MSSIQSQPTGMPLNNGFSMNGFSTPPPAAPSNNTSPANVFAQMKSGTFANEDAPNNNNGMTGQTPGWGQSYQGYGGY
jgi:hypothetical protein